MKLVCEVNVHTLWYESNEDIGPSNAGHREMIQNQMEFGTHYIVGYNRTKGNANATVTPVNGHFDLGNMDRHFKLKLLKDNCDMWYQ